MEGDSLCYVNTVWKLSNLKMKPPDAQFWENRNMMLDCKFVSQYLFQESCADRAFCQGNEAKD